MEECLYRLIFCYAFTFVIMKMVELHIVMPSSVLGLVLSSWMKSSAAQVPANYWSAPVDQSCHTTAFTLLMLALGVKVLCKLHIIKSGHISGNKVSNKANATVLQVCKHCY